MSFNLWQRGHRYYFRIPIPRPLRKLFLSSSGKPKNQIVEPISSDYESAKVECARRVARWTEKFNRLSAGETLADIERSEVAQEQHRQMLKRFIDEQRQGRSEVRLVSERGRSDEEIHRILSLIRPDYASTLDWLDKIGSDRSNRTRNAYAMSMALVIETARKRGRYQGENPFDGMKAKAAGESYQPFTTEELQTLFAALPREIKPKQHTPESALPWVTLIAAFTGMRLEEIAQLTVADIKTLGTNGGTVIAFDVHNGDDGHKLKNQSSARVIPLHSELVRRGLLDYVKALPKNGPLFPGLKRRESKGGKIGARLGELFRKRLIALGLKRDGLVFHSLRHNVATCLEQAAVSQTDTARVLGHAISGESFGTYSSGPGLARLKATVEEIRYEGLAS